MNNPTQLVLPQSLRDEILNALILGEEDYLSGFLGVSLEISQDACQAFKKTNDYFYRELQNSLDSERIARINRDVEQMHGLTVKTLIAHSQPKNEARPNH